MKLKVVEGYVVAVPENDRELTHLLGLAQQSRDPKIDRSVPRQSKYPAIPCIEPGCTAIVHGLKGMSVHVLRKHPELHTKENFPGIGGGSKKISIF